MEIQAKHIHLPKAKQMDLDDCLSELKEREVVELAEAMKVVLELLPKVLPGVQLVVVSK